MAEQFNPVPEWLTMEYIEKILQKYFADKNLKIIEMETKPAVAGGENFASVLIRINVKFSSGKNEIKRVTYLVKTTFVGQVQEVDDILSPFGIYQREMDMYELILPRLADLLRYSGDTEKLFADTVHVEREHFSIIFEDLSLENYVTLNRVSRLDKAHVKMALNKLAKFHATAAVLNEKSPGIFSQNFDRGLINRKTNVNEIMTTGMIKALARYVEQQPALKTKYHVKLLKLVDNLMEYGRRAYDVNEKDFMTLIHGDYWTTNMMFRYNEDQSLRNVIPIDFQFSCWASPAIDLHYFFNGSLREEQRLYEQPELVQYYYYVLSDTLRLLGYQGHIPSLYKFQLEFESRYFAALISAFAYQPVQIYDGKEEPTMQKLFWDNEAGRHLKDSFYQNVAVQKYVAELLPVFDQKGLLDVMD